MEDILSISMSVGVSLTKKILVFLRNYSSICNFKITGFLKKMASRWVVWLLELLIKLLPLQ